MTEVMVAVPKEAKLGEACKVGDLEYKYEPPWSNANHVKESLAVVDERLVLARSSGLQDVTGGTGFWRTCDDFCLIPSPNSDRESGLVAIANRGLVEIYNVVTGSSMRSLMIFSDNETRKHPGMKVRDLEVFPQDGDNPERFVIGTTFGKKMDQCRAYVAKGVEGDYEEPQMLELELSRAGGSLGSVLDIAANSGKFGKGTVAVALRGETLGALGFWGENGEWIGKVDGKVLQVVPGPEGKYYFLTLDGSVVEADPSRFGNDEQEISTRTIFEGDVKGNEKTKHISCIVVRPSGIIVASTVDGRVYLFDPDKTNGTCVVDSKQMFDDSKGFRLEELGLGGKGSENLFFVVRDPSKKREENFELWKVSLER